MDSQFAADVSGGMKAPTVAEAAQRPSQIGAISNEAHPSVLDLAFLELDWLDDADTYVVAGDQEDGPNI